MKQFLKNYKDQDDVYKKKLRKLVKLVKDQQWDKFTYEDVEDLDLFAFRQFPIGDDQNEEDSNILLEAFNEGIIDLIEYAFEPTAFINIRSLIRI